MIKVLRVESAEPSVESSRVQFSSVQAEVRGTQATKRREEA